MITQESNQSYHFILVYEHTSCHLSASKRMCRDVLIDPSTLSKFKKKYYLFEKKRFILTHARYFDLNAKQLSFHRSTNTIQMKVR